MWIATQPAARAQHSPRRDGRDGAGRRVAIASVLLLGEPSRAASHHLGRTAASADVTADRTVVLLVTGQPAEALVALDGVLAAAPRHFPGAVEQGARAATWASDHGVRVVRGLCEPG
jgi:hypothetical protein